MTEKPSSVIPDSEILSLLSSLKHRAEKSDELSAFFPSFVPVIDISLLGSRNTQVIYGRNGTGKTHILRCFEEMSLRNIRSYRVLPFYFDMRLLNVSRISPSLSEEDIVELFFSNFLYSCIQRIEPLCEHIASNPFSTAEQSAWLNSNKTQSAIRSALKRLRRAFNERAMRERIESYTKNIRSGSVKDASAGIAANASEAAAGITANISASAEASREEFIEVVIKASHFIDFNEIRNGFDELREALDVDQIVFLIDEWSQIDIGIQPVFAELIRRTIGTSNNISCKFAALKFMTAFTTVADNRRIGLQPGIDITELTDLNHIFTFDLDRKAVSNFLIYILIKHLLEEIGRNVYNFTFEDNSKAIYANVRRIFDRLFTNIFESKAAFEYFVRASEGNPRDFLAMVSECCATHGTAQLPITMQAVQVTAISYFKNTKMANFPDESASSLVLFNQIFQQCLQRKSKIFSVSKDIDSNNSDLRDLWSQRVIHLIDNQYDYFHEEEGRVFSYAIYAIDYGKILGLRSNKNGGEILDGLVNESKSLISSLYDGSSHKAILENISKEDSDLSALSQIIGSAPANDNVLDQTDFMAPEVVFQKIKNINVDDIFFEAKR